MDNTPRPESSIPSSDGVDGQPELLALVDIRQAEPRDRERVVSMAMHFLAATRYGQTFPGFEPSAERVANVFDYLAGGGGVVLVAEAPVNYVERKGVNFEMREIRPVVMGMIAIASAEDPLSGALYGDEMCWWVEPEFRQLVQGIGPKLLRSAEEWARQKGLSVLKMVAPAGSHVGTIYHRRGYVEVETAWSLVLDAGPALSIADAGLPPPRVW
jgi:GNAT superfamily N-acetyltransferase